MTVFRSESVSVERDATGGLELKLDVPGRAVNVVTRQVLADLDAALDTISAQGRVPLLVVRGGKKSGFLAGAALDEFLEIADANAARALSERGHRLFDKLAALPAPT